MIGSVAWRLEALAAGGRRTERRCGPGDDDGDETPIGDPPDDDDGDRDDEDDDEDEDEDDDEDPLQVLMP